MQVCALEHDVGNDAEYGQRDTFLYDLQLNKVKGTAIFYKAETSSGYLTAVLEEGYHPREGDDADEWPIVGYAVLLEFQMPIPSKRHEDVA